MRAGVVAPDRCCSNYSQSPILRHPHSLVAMEYLWTHIDPVSLESF